MFAMMASAADKVTLTVKNSLKSARAGEMVEVPFEQVKKKLGGAEQVVVTDADDDFTWFTPDEWTHAYLEMYEFVVNNLKFAKMKP